MQRQSRIIADKLLGPFVERFLSDGNHYDFDPKKRTRFTAEDIESLKSQYDNIDAEQCAAFARKAYLNHEGEEAFRNFIGVPKPGDHAKVRPSCI